MKQFDQVIENQYGIINGNKHLFFIKTGRGGSIFGYENKYLNICSIFSEKTGSAFVVSANSEDSEYDIEDELEQINKYVGDYEDVFYIGISNGALIGAQQCWRCPKIKNALLVNAPLMINWHKTKEGAEKFDGEHMRFLYGDEDPSYKMIGLINGLKNEKCKKYISNGNGHDFSQEELELEIHWFIVDCMYSIERFQINKGNKSAYILMQKAELLASDKDRDFGNLIYIYGRKGVGKTHLLWAFFDNPSPGSFPRQFDDAKDVGKDDHYLDYYCYNHLAVMDDVNMFSEKRQFDALKGAISLTGVEDDFVPGEDKVVLILSSDAPPEDTFDDPWIVEMIYRGTVVEMTEEKTIWVTNRYIKCPINIESYR